jgi:hypothetical protein
LNIERASPASLNEGSAEAPARFHILITDGVQSTNNERTDISCTKGSDYFCVKNSISMLLRNNWGGAVLGIRSEFKGKVYSEVKRGDIFQYESTRGKMESYRPFYLYIFSPDRHALNEFVRVIKERLHQVVGSGEDTIREYALTQPYSEGAAESAIMIPSESSDSLEVLKAKEGNPARHTIKVNPSTEKTGPKPFTVTVRIPWSNHAIDSGTRQELLSALRWELVQVYPEQQPASSGEERVRYPELKIVNREVGDDDRAVIHMSAIWPPNIGSMRWRAYRLEGRLNLDAPAPPWVQRWSTNTDRTTDVASRTLNLESSLSGLWRNPTLAEQVVAEVYLRVGPL